MGKCNTVSVAWLTMRGNAWQCGIGSAALRHESNMVPSSSAYGSVMAGQATEQSGSQKEMSSPCRPGTM